MGQQEHDERLRISAHRLTDWHDALSADEAEDMYRAASIEIRALREELRGHIARHDAEHERQRREHGELLRELRAEVDANTIWRHERQALEGLVRWLVGSNVGVLIAAVITLLALLGVANGS